MKKLQKHKFSLNFLGLFLMAVAVIAYSPCLVLIGEPKPPKCLLEE